MSLSIDYKDHYSYFDKDISAYNFLRYSDLKWLLFNPPSHHQNRLRHRDYLDLLVDGGFQILSDTHIDGDKDDIEFVSDFPVHRRFSRYSAQELSVKSSTLIATPCQIC